ncbi:MAG: ferrochelatase [Nitrospirae bacterium]|nr:ferrochelatase [Nitrospirota bacterium]
MIGVLSCILLFVIGVILLNLGGPDSLDAVEPFLYNLFSDRDIIRLGPSFFQKPIASLIVGTRLKKALSIYRLIGGKSPLRDITTAQAKALELSLNSSHSTRLPSRSFKVYVGMRYWHPFTGESLEQMQKDGINKIVALSLYPHYSAATTGSSIRDFKNAAADYSFEYVCVTSWFHHPLYIEALAARIEERLKGFADKPVVLFSAHSLPQKLVDAGDPYVEEISGTIDALTKKLDFSWFLSFQSKTGPIKWLGPSTKQMLHDLAGKGIKNLLVVPISFVSDHIETLYEIDILYKGMAKNIGITLERTESLNTSPIFIEALSDIVLNYTRGSGWI